MKPLLLLARHLARHWLAYLLASLAAGMLVADFSGVFGFAGQTRLSSLGLAPVLVPLLLVCIVLWAVGVRLDDTRRRLELVTTELERAQTLGRTGNWSLVDGRFDWSPRALQILGVEASLVQTFEQLSERVAVEDRSQLERAWRTAQAGAHYRAEFGIGGPHGVRRLLFEGQLESVDEAGRRRVAGIVQDMTERFRMEGELRRAMRYQQALLDNFPFMVWLKDRNLRFLAVNRPLARAGGLKDPADARGLQDHDLWPAELADGYRADDLEVLRARAPRGSESLVVSAGRSAWYEIWKAPVLDDDGGLLGTVGFARDISERKDAEASLKRSRDQLATLGRLQARFIQGETGDTLFRSMLEILLDLSASDDGFLAEVVRDLHGKAHVNLLACCETDWLGEREDLIERALQTDGGSCSSGAIVASAADSGTARGLVCIAVIDDGSMVGLIGLSAPDGRFAEDVLAGVRAAVSTFGLILHAGMREQARQRAETELKRHRDRLAEMVEEQLSDSMSARRIAEHANRAKSLFLASMSHELRTPIHAILGFSRLALRDRPPLADATRRRFETIRENGDRLLALVDDLLDLSRLEAGGIQLNATACNVSELVQEAVSEMDATAVGRDVAIRVDDSLAAPLIKADAYRLLQVLHKLLDNAIRFSPQSGEVVVSLTGHVDNRRNGVLLGVSDLGPGIPDGELERVFDQFERASRIRGPAGGSGLGLAICREIVVLHHGWIRAANRPDCGTCIEIWLPDYDEADRISFAPEPPELPDPPTTKPLRTATVR
jgi:PAS domain S-box-containing protein